MGEAMARITVNGRPITKLHGLRMLNPDVFSHVPFHSADSTNAALNAGLDVRWPGPYSVFRPRWRAVVIMERNNEHASAERWANHVQEQMQFANPEIVDGQ